MTEFNLSEKIGETVEFIEHRKYTTQSVPVKDVKEFIKRYEEKLRKLGVDIQEKVIDVEFAIFELRRLAGDKLQ